VTTLDPLQRSYRTAFLRYLGRHEEPARLAGYELGRAALAADVGLLDVVRMHHDVLIEVLRDSPAAEHLEISAAAAEFLLEVLSPYDMAQRGFPRSR